MKEFCPRCQSYQDMQVTASQWEKADSEGNVSKMVTKVYDCGKCGMTVRSKDIEAAEKAGDSQAKEKEETRTDKDTAST